MSSGTASRLTGIETERLPPLPPQSDVLGFAVPLELGSADGDRRITTLTSFATAADVTLAGLYLEVILPADELIAEVRH